MNISLTVNGTLHILDVQPGELLRTALRRLRYYSVKFGDETGDTGADAVLLTFTPDDPHSYRLRNTSVLLAAQADGASIMTVESLSGREPPAASALQEQPSSRPARSSAATARPAQLLAAKRCWRRIQPHRGTRCARRSPACCAAAPATSGRWRRCCGGGPAARRGTAAGDRPPRSAGQRDGTAATAGSRSSRRRPPAAGAGPDTAGRDRVYPSWSSRLRPRRGTSAFGAARSMPSSWPRASPVFADDIDLPRHAVRRAC